MTWDDATGVWRYDDTWEPVSGAPLRACGECGLAATPEGHDGCLGTLPGGVLNACCGHGREDEAYIQYADRTVRGAAARGEQVRLVEERESRMTQVDLSHQSRCPRCKRRLQLAEMCMCLDMSINIGGPAGPGGPGPIVGAIALTVYETSADIWHPLRNHPAGSPGRWCPLTIGVSP